MNFSLAQHLKVKIQAGMIALLPLKTITALLAMVNSPDIPNSIGAGRHIISTTSEDNLSISNKNLLTTIDNRLKTRATQPIH